MMTRTVKTVSPQGETTLASFELAPNGHVVATYFSNSFRREMEGVGIFTAATGKLTPRDGRVFLESLPVAYANSSRVAVYASDDDGEDVDDEDVDVRTDYNPDQPRSADGRFGECGGSVDTSALNALPAIPSGHVRLYRATERGEAAAGAHFGENVDTGVAYMNNPGFGGSKLFAYDVPEKHVLEVPQKLRGRDALEYLAKELEYDDPAETARSWADAGNMRVFQVLENERDVNKKAGELYDWISFEDDFPEGARTWKYLGADKLQGTQIGSARTDYSPDQPRSADGRFGEGGGSSALKAPGSWGGPPSEHVASLRAQAKVLHEKYLALRLAEGVRKEYGGPMTPADEVARQSSDLEDQAKAARTAELRAAYSPDAEVVTHETGTDYKGEPSFDLAEGYYDHVDAITKPGMLYRGMSQREFDATVGKGQGIHSKNKYSDKSEGTSFGEDFGTAAGYINLGRSHPLKTEKPTYVVEVKKSQEHTPYNSVAGYHQTQPGNKVGLPHDQITRVWKFQPAGGKVTMKEIPVPAASTEPFEPTVSEAGDWSKTSL